MKFVRLVFIFVVSLGNVLFLGEHSLSFFLFNLLLFAIIFAPYSLLIQKRSQFFIIPILGVFISYLLVSGISFLKMTEETPRGKMSILSEKRQKIRTRLSERQSLSSVKTMRASKKKWERVYGAHFVKPSLISFWKTPKKWYKRRILRLYGFALGVSKHKLYCLFAFVMFTLVYTIILFSSSSMISAVYALLVFFLLPLIFSQLYSFFLHEGGFERYYIVSYSMLCTIILLGYLKVQKLKA